MIGLTHILVSLYYNLPECELQSHPLRICVPRPMHLGFYHDLTEAIILSMIFQQRRRWWFGASGAIDRLCD